MSGRAPTPQSAATGRYAPGGGDTSPSTISPDTTRNFTMQRITDRPLPFPRSPRTARTAALLGVLVTVAACDDRPLPSAPSTLVVPAPVAPALGVNVGGNNRRILFASDRDTPNSLEVYSMNPVGSGVSRLTDSPGVDHATAWSPDGKRIALVGARHDPDGEITVM